MQSFPSRTKAQPELYQPRTQKNDRFLSPWRVKRRDEKKLQKILEARRRAMELCQPELII